MQTGSEAFIGSLLAGLGAGYQGVRRIRTDRQADEDRDRRMEAEDYSLDEWLRSIGRGGLRTPDWNPNAGNAPSAPQAVEGMDGAPVLTPPPIGAPGGSQGLPQGGIAQAPNPAGPIRRRIGDILSGFTPYGQRRQAPAKIGPSDAEASTAARHAHELGMQDTRFDRADADREDQQRFDAEQRRLDREARAREVGAVSSRPSQGDAIQRATLARQTANEIQSRMNDLKQIAFSRPQQLIPLHARSLEEAQALVNNAMNEYRALEMQYNQWMDTAQRLSATAVGVELRQGVTDPPPGQGAQRGDVESQRRQMIAEAQEAIAQGRDESAVYRMLDEDLARIGARPRVRAAVAEAPVARQPAALSRVY